jgi:hypothetical protein
MTADRPSLDVIVDAARVALANHEPPAPEVLGAVEAGLVRVKAPLAVVPQPAAARTTGGPRLTRRCAG